MNLVFWKTVLSRKTRHPAGAGVRLTNEDQQPYSSIRQDCEGHDPRSFPVHGEE